MNKQNKKLSAFDRILSVSSEDIELVLRGETYVPWADFLLNPRRLRGSDFLMRWSQGVWSEKRLVQAVNDTDTFFALPYGPSSVAPNEVREFELYFERLEKAGHAGLKRPDLLLFHREDRMNIESIVADIGGIAELPFAHEEDKGMRELLKRSILAIECENSLWVSKKMPDYGTKLSAQKWLGGGLGLRKSAVLPTVILKEEDRSPLREWQGSRGKKIHIWHMFYDAAYGLALDDAEQLIEQGHIRATEQTFQAPSGPTTKKQIYKIYYQYAYILANAVEEPHLVADHILDKNGHILPFVRFEGGRVKLAEEAQNLLQKLGARR